MESLFNEVFFDWTIFTANDYTRIVENACVLVNFEEFHVDELDPGEEEEIKQELGLTSHPDSKEKYLYLYKSPNSMTALVVDFEYGMTIRKQ